MIEGRVQYSSDLEYWYPKNSFTEVLISYRKSGEYLDMADINYRVKLTEEEFCRILNECNVLLMYQKWFSILGKNITDKLKEDFIFHFFKQH